MISFVVKTWFWWWLLVIIIALRWFHLLRDASQMEPAEMLTAEEKEAIVSRQLRTNGQVISMFDRERAS
jgi:hypothetical protein